jgi:hypothetical protein
MSRNIAAVTVNHNTSAYVELLLRSLVTTHPPLTQLGLSVTVLDNASEDDTSQLHAFATSAGIPIRQAGYTTHTKHNSHGDNLRNFVLDNPDATHYLFLDADAVFSQPNAIQTMADELDAAPDDVFAIGARIASPWEPEKHKVLEPERIANLYERRLHPFCALMRNTPLYRRAVENLGLSECIYRWVDREQFIDTNELISIAMRTFGYRYLHSSALVCHFFAVSYDYYGKDRLDALAIQRDLMLAKLRAEESVPGGQPA